MGPLPCGVTLGGVMGPLPFSGDASQGSGTPSLRSNYQSNEDTHPSEAIFHGTTGPLSCGVSLGGAMGTVVG